MSVEQELEDVIKRNLPSAVGDALRQKLEQADKDAARVTQLRDDVESLKREKAALERRIVVAESGLQKQAELTKREEEMSKREREAKIFELTTQLNAANENARFARDVAMGLVRNVEYRSSVMESTTNKSHPVQGNGAYSGFVGNSPTTETTSVTESRTAS